MELQGTIVLIRPEHYISENFSKREFVIETNDGQYSQEILLELHKDKISIIDGFAEGEEVKCSINIRGKRFSKEGQEDKFFNTIICWKIDKVQS